jgi:hypothetical protein
MRYEPEPLPTETPPAPPNLKDSPITYGMGENGAVGGYEPVPDAQAAVDTPEIEREGRQAQFTADKGINTVPTAETVENKPLDEYSNAQLRSMAADWGIDVSKAKNKDQLVAAIRDGIQADD